MDSSSAAAKAVIGMIFICYFFYNLAWSGLLIETLPYKIRAKGLTVMFLRVDLVRKFPSSPPCRLKAPKLTSSPLYLLQPIHQSYCP
jgi:hypothetical protein